MSAKDLLRSSRVWLVREASHLLAVAPNSRPLELPVCAALASGLPVVIAALFGFLPYGATASLGGMAFLSLPATPLWHRMAAIMAATTGLCACFALGLISHHIHPAVLAPLLAALTALALAACRWFRFGPPGPTFYVMAAAIGGFMPTTVPEIPLQVGLVTMGGLLAVVIAFVYSLATLRRLPPVAPAPPPPFLFEPFLMEPVVIGLGVGVALALAENVGLERPYWAAISCLAVAQTASLRAVWTRQVHRVTGTAIGLALAFALLALPLPPLAIATAMTVLTFCVEMVIARHYGMGIVFATPLAILLAETATGSNTPTAALIEARLLDTLLGSLVGFLTGVVLHQPKARTLISRAMARLMPERLRP